MVDTRQGTVSRDTGSNDGVEPRDQGQTCTAYLRSGRSGAQGYGNGFCNHVITPPDSRYNGSACLPQGFQRIL